MTEKELKKLNRNQLLELILIQTEQIEHLQKQLESTNAQLEATTAQLNDHTIQVSRAGSIAEAALQISGVFEAAQSAADLYLAKVKEQEQSASRIEADARAAAEKRIADAEQTAAGIVEEASRKADALMAETEQKCQQKEAAANSYIAQMRDAVQDQFRNLEQLFPDKN